jgi:hypothetical protein
MACEQCGNVHETVTHDLMCKQWQELQGIKVTLKAIKVQMGPD